MAEFVQNGGFGSGYSNWNCGHLVSVYTNGGRTGGATDGCAGFSNNSEGGARDLYQKITGFVPGRSYTLKYWAKRRGRYDTWAAYSYYDTNNRYQYINLASKESLLENEVYKPITYTITIPTDAGPDFWIWIRGGADAADNGCFLFIDDVSFTGDATGGSTGPSIGSGMVNGDYANITTISNVRNSYGLSAPVLYSTQVHEQFMIMNSFAHTDGYTWYLVVNQNRKITNGWIRGDLLTKLPTGMGGKRMFLIAPASGTTVNVRDTDGGLLTRWPKGRLFAGTYCDGGAKVRTFYVKAAKPATIDSQFLSLQGTYPGIITALVQVCEKEAALGMEKANYDATDAKWDWCQTFANWTAMLAGASWDSKYSINGCTSMMNSISSAYKTRAVSPNVPMIGDWVFYDRNGNGNDFEHVGVVITASSSTMTTIEGNRSTKVEKFSNLPLYSAPSGSNNAPYYFVRPPFKV